MIHIHPVRYIVEIQNGTDVQGMHCSESIEVSVCDEGGGPFLVLACRNLEPDDEYGPNTVSLEENDIQPLADALKGIMETAQK